MLRIALDIDGVITANPEFFKWFVYHMTKMANGHVVYIVSGRHPSRLRETEEELKFWGIDYKSISLMPMTMDRSLVSQALWKIQTVKELGIDMWFDDDFEIWEKAFAIDVNEKLPDVIKIQI